MKVVKNQELVSLGALDTTVTKTTLEPPPLELKFGNTSQAL